MEFEDLDLNNDWKRLMYLILSEQREKTKRTPYCFLIGVNELGKGKKTFYERKTGFNAHRYL